jgi:hypothetical protein
MVRTDRRPGDQSRRDLSHQTVQLRFELGYLLRESFREELPQGVSTRTNVLRRVLRPPDVRKSR